MIKSAAIRYELSMRLEQTREPADSGELSRARGVPIARAVTARAKVAAPAFYRVVYEAPHNAGDYALLRYLYGAELLFDPTLRDPRAIPRAPVRVPGIVLHNDLDEDPRLFVGAHNPALANRHLHAKLADKCEEHALLLRAAPELAVETIRGDFLLPHDFPRAALEAEAAKTRSGALLSRDFPRSTREPAAASLGGRLFPENAEHTLAHVQEQLATRFGRYILKPRRGFGSDGYLPTHEHDFTELWRAHVEAVIPARARIFRETLDEDERTRRLYEELDAPESLVLELLLRDPTAVIAQPHIAHRDELRVHLVEGRILRGATTRRWWRRGAGLDPRLAASAEAAVLKLCASSSALRILSAAPDILVAKDGSLKLIDLNPGLESGMYSPENDISITNLLAARFTGRETDYLRDLRRLAEAPLPKKFDQARALESKIGAFIQANESYGFHDRITDIYVNAAATPEDTREAHRQLVALGFIDQHERDRFLRETRGT